MTPIAMGSGVLAPPLATGAPAARVVFANGFHLVATLAVVALAVFAVAGLARLLRATRRRSPATLWRRLLPAA